MAFHNIPSALVPFRTDHPGQLRTQDVQTHCAAFRPTVLLPASVIVGIVTLRCEHLRCEENFTVLR